MTDKFEIPLEVLRMLEDVDMIEEHDDNGPGRVYCPVCEQAIAMKWHNGRQTESPYDIVHDDNCPVAWAAKQMPIYRKELESMPYSSKQEYDERETAAEQLTYVRHQAPEYRVAQWECVVTGTDGDMVWCDAHLMGPGANYQEFWQLEVPGNKWTEGQAFYVLKPR